MASVKRAKRAGDWFALVIFENWLTSPNASLAFMRVTRLSFPCFAALAAFCGIFLFSGCAWRTHERPEAGLAPGPRRVGTVAVVNDDLRFVLVDVGSLYTPAAGTALKSFSGGRETGILAVDPEKQRPFIVADIVKGEPKVGDQVEE
jgi:hypothetical protein